MGAQDQRPFPPASEVVAGRNSASMGFRTAGTGVRGDSATGAGVVGTSPHVIGVLGVQGTGPDLRDTAGGFGGAAVTGSADDGIGVLGHSNQNPGVRGDSTEDSGVVGVSDIAAGVEGRSRTEFGVLGLGPVGVKGVTIDGVGVVGLNGVGVDPTTIGAFGVAGTFRRRARRAGPFEQRRWRSRRIRPGDRGDRDHRDRACRCPRHQHRFLRGNRRPRRTGPDLRPSGSAGVGGSSDDTPGVLGNSARGIGVFGLHGTAHDLTPFSQAGVVGFSPDTPGLLGRSGSDAGIRGESTSGPAIHGISTSPGGVAGQFDGNVIVNGDLNVTGAKSAVVHSRDGSFRKLYAVESPESWFEDFGTAQLEYGHAHVRLDAIYAALIRSDDYRVFLTPLGDCKGLYVDARSPQGFDVHELQGGTKCIRFDYRVVAKRADITAPRLERV